MERLHVLEQTILVKISASLLLLSTKLYFDMIQILLNKSSVLLKLEDEKIYFLLCIYRFFPDITLSLEHQCRGQYW